jgi:TM2 domain-containing membrane protein YozV
VKPNSHPQQAPKNLAFAAFLAWLVPGLGHLYLDRKFKGIMFTILINGLFLSGWVMSYGEAMSLHKEDGHRYAFLAQVGAGGPQLLAIIYTHSAEIFSNFDEDVIDDLRLAREDKYQTPEYYTRLPWTETGLLYCMIAGLLNLLIIYEASTGGEGIAKSIVKKEDKLTASRQGSDTEAKSNESGG